MIWFTMESSVKKLHVVERKQYNWWKRNSNAVRKLIDGRHASGCLQSDQTIIHGYVFHCMRNNFYAKVTIAILLSDLHVTEELPSIHDVLKLSKNLQTRQIVCDHFLSCVVGKKQ